MSNLSPFQSTFKWALESTWPMLCLFIVILVVSRLSYIIINKKRIVLYNDIFVLVSILYVLLLYFMLLSTDYASLGINLYPYREMSRYVIGSTAFFYNVIGNILIFIPFGFILSHSIKASRIKHIVIPSFIVSLSVEIVQYYIGRTFDVDDVILNTVGALVGFMIYISFRHFRDKLPNSLKKEWFYNTLAVLTLLGGIIFIISIWWVKL